MMELFKGQILENTKDFVLAGKAIFTIKNEETNKHFTYKIKHVRFLDSSKKDDKLWFVSALTGNDNNHDYKYLGVINSKGQFIHGKKSKISKEAMTVVAIEWFMNHVDNLPKKVTVWHEGRCGRCGKRLTIPESIKSGFGPECIKRMM